MSHRRARGIINEKKKLRKLKRNIKFIFTSFPKLNFSHVNLKEVRLSNLYKMRKKYSFYFSKN